MRLIILSDTHNLHSGLAPLPDGDVLVHAGDMTGRGTLGEIEAFVEWFAALPHRHKIMIAGNHDFAFETSAAAAEALVPEGVTYLRDAATIIEGIKFWGSPWQPWFYDWAFNLERGEEIARKWALIPNDVEVLITHGPPHGVLDTVVGVPAEHVGCAALLARLDTLPALRLHVFGHIHEAYGSTELLGRRFVNACICDEGYRPVNAPIVIDL